ncbi:DUF6193 family natural product biosynthesis protein [Streptomyces olindensis]|uniref:DUF6193 family natural product biosynthesis protein n=1 Tax=Streptomyces olindensis TaxID=358823 RepID=UPI0033DE8A98
MPTPPDPAELYPDVAAYGSLATALRSVAGGCLATVPVTAPLSDLLLSAAVDSALPHREPLQITAWSHERRWSIRGEDSFQGLALIDGRTDDLAQVARAARAWHDGAPLGDVRQTAPFVHLTGRFEVPDRDPGRLTESEWQGMRQEAAELEYAWAQTYRELIEAAHAEPALRALYPFTSHWALRFSSTTRPGLTIVGPCLSANGDGTFGMGTGIISQDLGRFATAREAVAAAVHRLPPDIGPTRPGG